MMALGQDNIEALLADIRQYVVLFQRRIRAAPSAAPSCMRTYAADDASISENLRRICSTEQRPPPLVAGVCALTIGKMQAECKLCAPDLPCFGCVKKRNPTAGVADCIICAGTSKPCPSR
jgi:hypothetical protein